MADNEKYYHVCPRCGLTMPIQAPRCDCGYVFKKSQNKPPLSVIITIFAVLLSFVAGFGFAKLPERNMSTATIPPKYTENNPSSVPLTPTKPVQPSQKSDYSNLNSDASLSPKTVHNGDIIVKPNAEMIAPLSISTTQGLDYYVVLKCLSDSNCNMSLFISGGQTVSTEVPIGEYEIYYATGKDWYNQEDLFGSQTVRYKCEERFNFRINGDYVEGYTLTLYAVLNGNMETTQISERSFPKI